MLGLGHDIVDVAAFSDQLSQPGSHMRALFSVREVRQASLRARLKHDGEAVHLAAKWAGKEAVIKAWCESLGSAEPPYTLDNTPWSGIEILDDSLGRPHVILRDDVARQLQSSIPALADRGAQGTPQWHISLSHDKGIASAIVVVVVVVVVS
ncbi:holo-ACP synthase [Bifidobacterium leontopitheci]